MVIIYKEASRNMEIIEKLQKTHENLKRILDKLQMRIGSLRKSSANIEKDTSPLQMQEMERPTR